MSTTTCPTPAVGGRTPARQRGGRIGSAVPAVAMGATVGGLAGMVVDPHGWYALAVSLGWVVWLVPGLARVSESVHRAAPGQVSRHGTTAGPWWGLRRLGGLVLAGGSGVAVLLPTLLG